MKPAAEGRAGAADAEGLVNLVIRHGLETVVAVEGVWRARDRRIQRDDRVEGASGSARQPGVLNPRFLPSADVIIHQRVAIDGVARGRGSGSRSQGSEGGELVRGRRNGLKRVVVIKVGDEIDAGSALAQPAAHILEIDRDRNVIRGGDVRFDDVIAALIAPSMAAALEGW